MMDYEQALDAMFHDFEVFAFAFNSNSDIEKGYALAFSRIYNVHPEQVFKELEDYAEKQPEW